MYLPICMHIYIYIFLFICMRVTAPAHVQSISTAVWTAPRIDYRCRFALSRQDHDARTGLVLGLPVLLLPVWNQLLSLQAARSELWFGTVIAGWGETPGSLTILYMTSRVHKVLVRTSFAQFVYVDLFLFRVPAASGDPRTANTQVPAEGCFLACGTVYRC